MIISVILFQHLITYKNDDLHVFEKVTIKNLNRIMYFDPRIKWCLFILRLNFRLH